MLDAAQTEMGFDYVHSKGHNEAPWHNIGSANVEEVAATNVDRNKRVAVFEAWNRTMNRELIHTW